MGVLRQLPVFRDGDLGTGIASKQRLRASLVDSSGGRPGESVAEGQQSTTRFANQKIRIPAAEAGACQRKELGREMPPMAKACPAIQSRHPKPAIMAAHGLEV